MNQIYPFLVYCIFACFKQLFVITGLMSQFRNASLRTYKSPSHSRVLDNVEKTADTFCTSHNEPVLILFLIMLSVCIVSNRPQGVYKLTFVPTLVLK